MCYNNLNNESHICFTQGIWNILWESDWWSRVVPVYLYLYSVPLGFVYKTQAYHKSIAHAYEILSTDFAGEPKTFHPVKTQLF